MQSRKKWDGLSHLVFSRRNNRTISSKTYFEGNSRLSANTASRSTPFPYYFLVNLGGGFLEGEHYRITIELEDQAQATVTTQAPTYIYKCDKNQKLTHQESQIHIGKGAYLEYLTDEIIPYAKSRFFQETTFSMEEGAELIYSDGVTAGWSQDYLPFQYTDFHSLTQIFYNNRLIYRDNILLEPQKDDLSQLGYFEGYSNYNSLVIISNFVNTDFVEGLRQHLNSISSQSWFGLSELSTTGLALKLLSHSSYENQKIIKTCVDYYRKQVHQLPTIQLRKNESRG